MRSRTLIAACVAAGLAALAAGAAPPPATTLGGTIVDREQVIPVPPDRETLAATAPLIDALGGAEDLAAHVEAVRVRVES